MLHKKIILLDTRDAVKLVADGKISTSHVEFSLSSAQISLKKVRRVGVVGIEMCNCFYNITERNNTMNFIEYSDQYITPVSTFGLVISPGHYSATDLIAVLNTDLAGIMTVILNSVTRKMEFTKVTPTTYYEFDYNNSTGFNLIGLNANLTSLDTTIIPPNLPDLRGVTTVLFKFDKFFDNNISTTSKANAEEFYHTLFLSSSFMNTTHWEAPTSSEIWEYRTPTNLDGSFIVKVQNRNREFLDNNGFDWRMKLFIEYER